MSIETRTVPCRIQRCVRRVLQYNDQWHLYPDEDGSFRFLVGHDFGEEGELPDPDEDIENYYE